MAGQAWPEMQANFAKRWAAPDETCTVHDRLDAHSLFLVYERGLRWQAIDFLTVRLQRIKSGRRGPGVIHRD